MGLRAIVVYAVVVGASACKNTPPPDAPEPEPEPASGRSPVEPAREAPAVEPDDGPTAPGGADACTPPAEAATVSDIAMHCYETRLRPSLGTLADSPEVADYRFGAAEYLRGVLALRPTLQTPPTRTGAALRRRYLEGLPDDLVRQITALGSRDQLDDARTYAPVHIVLRADGMPTDGHMELVVFVDEQSRAVPLVIRLLHG